MDGDEGRRTKDEGGGGGREDETRASPRRIDGCTLSAPVNEGNSRRLTLDRDAAFLLSLFFAPVVSRRILFRTYPRRLFLLLLFPRTFPVVLFLRISRSHFAHHSRFVDRRAAGHLCPSPRRDIAINDRRRHVTAISPYERTRPLITFTRY